MTIGQYQSNTILVIEDDPHTLALVAFYLEREGYHVHTAPDGRKGMELAQRHFPDLVILDLMLPLLDGWEVCRRLRQNSEVAIIMLTARDEEIDRVAGLTLGADDYVVKPFSPSELVARVQAVLRRMPRTTTTHPKVIHCGDLVLDLENRRLNVSGHSVELTPHEYALLVALASRPGRTFTRDELLARLYPDGAVYAAWHNGDHQSAH